MALVVETLPANVGDVRDAGSISGLGRCSGGGHGNPLQYSCLENPMDRGVWWPTVHGSQSRIGLSDLAQHSPGKGFSPPLAGGYCGLLCQLVTCHLWFRNSDASPCVTNDQAHVCERAQGKIVHPGNSKLLIQT